MSLESLKVSCDGKRKHLPWSVSSSGFATAQERNYPTILCKRYAKAAKRFLLPKEEKVVEDKSFKVHLETQPRRGMQEIIPEFKAVEVFSRCSLEEIKVAERSIKDRKAHLVFRGLDLAEGHRVLSLDV